MPDFNGLTSEYRPCRIRYFSPKFAEGYSPSSLVARLPPSAKGARTTTVEKVTKEYLQQGRLHVLQDKPLPEYATIVRIHGPFLFGTVEKLSAISDHIENLAPVVILRLRNMTAIDATGLMALEDFADKLHGSGRHLILCGARQQPAKLIRQAELGKHVGQDNICQHITAALERAKKVYETSIKQFG